MFNTGKPKDLTQIIKQFHSDFIETALGEREGVELPLAMGKVVMVSYKTPSYNNYKQFRKGALITKHTNNHTDGLNCKIFYSNAPKRYRFKDKVMWAFEPHYKFSKAASVSFAANHVFYKYSPDSRQTFYRRMTFNAEEKRMSKIEAYLKKFDELCIN